MAGSLGYRLARGKSFRFRSLDLFKSQDFGMFERIDEKLGAVKRWCQKEGAYILMVICSWFQYFLMFCSDWFLRFAILFARCYAFAQKSNNTMPVPQKATRLGFQLLLALRSRNFWFNKNSFEVGDGGWATGFVATNVCQTIRLLHRTD